MKKIFYIITLLSLIGVFLVGLFAYVYKKPIEQKNFTVGIVNPNPGMDMIITGFIDGMSFHGYAEGKNIKYIIHKSENGMEDAINKMVSQKVDLIYTLTTPATKMAKNATEKNGIPVVFTMHDPVSSGLIESLSRPGANLTGIQLRGSTPKALEWLLALKPETKNILVPVKFDTKAAKQSLDDLKETAAHLGVSLTVSEVNSGDELEALLSTLSEDIDAIFVIHSIMIFANVDKILTTSIARHIPIASGSSLHEQGVTIAFGHNSFRVGKQASRLASRILEGKSAADTPSEIAVFYLGINLKTAQESGINVPKDLLLQADYVVR